MGQHATILSRSISAEILLQKACIQDFDTTKQSSTETELVHDEDKLQNFDKMAIAQFFEKKLLGSQMNIPNEGMGTVQKVLGICSVENHAQFLGKAGSAIVVVLTRLRDGRKFAVQIRVTSTDFDTRQTKEEKSFD